MFEDRSPFFFLLLLVLSIGVIQSMGVGFLFFFKKSGERRAHIFFGLLLLTLGLTLLHNIFLLIDLTLVFPEWQEFPIYYTLAFPTLLFFYVKLDLYPSYQFKWTDAKHFVLPVAQVSFFILLSLGLLNFGVPLNRYFFNPFYGAVEQLLYLTFFFAYIYFASRYVRQKRKVARNRAIRKKINYHQTLLQILFVLFCVHTFFVISDYIYYNYFFINLRHSKPFAALGLLSFAALVFWIATYGFQVLFWGRKLFRNGKSRMG